MSGIYFISGLPFCDVNSSPRTYHNSVHLNAVSRTRRKNTNPEWKYRRFDRKGTLNIDVTRCHGVCDIANRTIIEKASCSAERRSDWLIPGLIDLCPATSRALLLRITSDTQREHSCGGISHDSIVTPWHEERLGTSIGNRSHVSVYGQIAKSFDSKRPAFRSARGISRPRGISKRDFVVIPGSVARWEANGFINPLADHAFSGNHTVSFFLMLRWTYCGN